MKKKILFAVIALVTLLAFTGCDKILEFMFPDSTGGGDGGWGENSIQVQISVADPSIEWWNYTIWVELNVVVDGVATPFGEAYRSGGASVPFNDPDATPIASFRYDGLPDGVYSVRAWMDIDGTWDAQATDPFAQGHTDMGMMEFALPFLDIYGNTSNEVWVFGELMLPIDIGGGTSFLFIRDGLTQDANYPYFVFNVDSTVSYTNYDSISFDIYDPWGYWIYGNTSYGNQIVADLYSYGYTTLSAGTYTLSIYSATEAGGASATPWQWSVPFQVVNTWTAYGTVWPDVVSYGLGNSPINLGGTASHPVHMEFYDEYNSWMGNSDVPGSYGWFEAWGYWSYQTPGFYSGGSGMTAGRVRIFVDADDNGNYYDSMDWAAEQVIWVDNNTYFDGTYYLPYLNVDYGRFIPYVDFSRIYP